MRPSREPFIAPSIRPGSTNLVKGSCGAVALVLVLVLTLAACALVGYAVAHLPLAGGIWN